MTFVKSLTSVASIAVFLWVGTATWPARVVLGDESGLRQKLLDGARQYQNDFRRKIVCTEGVVLVKGLAIDVMSSPDAKPTPRHVLNRFEAKYGDGRFYYWKEGTFQGVPRAFELGWTGKVQREVHYENNKPVRGSQTCVAPPHQILPDDAYLGLKIAFGANDGDAGILPQEDSTWLQAMIERAQSVEPEPGASGKYRVRYSDSGFTLTAVVSLVPVVHCVFYECTVTEPDRSITAQRCAIEYQQRGMSWLPVRSSRTLTTTTAGHVRTLMVNSATYQQLTFRENVPDEEFLMPIPPGIPFRDFCKKTIPSVAFNFPQ